MGQPPVEPFQLIVGSAMYAPRRTVALPGGRQDL